jgi:serine/threonine-protein kinase
VLDFGISKVSHHDPTGLNEPSFVTKTNAIMGSPFYMSPEQMLSSASVDQRSDIWSLGVTLYELLTKNLPFAADSAAAVCRRIMHDEPTPLRKLRPHYPKGLEDIISRCLQKRPEHRFQNVTDLAMRLADFGPNHGRFAVKSIRELIEATEPESSSAQVSVANEDTTTSDTANVTDTTVYLPSGPVAPEGSWKRTAALLGTAGIAFALGVGVGWVLNLNTDPTRGGGYAAAPPLPPPATQASNPSDATTTAATTAAPTANENAIDLDSRAADGAASGSKAPPPAPAQNTAQNSTGAKTAAPFVPKTATPTPPPKPSATAAAKPTPSVTF